MTAFLFVLAGFIIGSGLVFLVMRNQPETRVVDTPAVKLVTGEIDPQGRFKVDAGGHSWQGDDLGQASRMIESARRAGVPYIYFVDGVEKKRG